MMEFWPATAEDVSAPFPFRTPLGRMLDDLSKHPQLQPYAAIVRRFLRKFLIVALRVPYLNGQLRRLTGSRLAFAGAVFLAIVAVLFFWNQSLKAQKLHLYADIQKVSNLQQIRLDIRQFSLRVGRLPTSLKEIESGNFNPNFARDDYFYDPDTSRLLEYQPVSAGEYKLCTVFHYSSSYLAEQVPDSAADDTIWRHDPGYHCFTFATAIGRADGVP